MHKYTIGRHLEGNQWELGGIQRRSEGNRWRWYPSPIPSERNAKVPNFDGNNTYRCSDKAAYL